MCRVGMFVLGWMSHQLPLNRAGRLRGDYWDDVPMLCEAPSEACSGYFVGLRAPLVVSCAHVFVCVCGTM